MKKITLGILIGILAPLIGLRTKPIFANQETISAASNPLLEKEVLPAIEFYKPYAREDANFIYNLLFCDDPSLFKPKKGETLTSWQTVLFNSNPDAKAIRSIAENEKEESRVRVLAYNWLIKNKQQTPKGQLLGIIVEVALDEGLDTLAAYSDGQVRYINHTGKMTLLEAAPTNIEGKVKELIAAAQETARQIGPWTKSRLPQPRRGNIRLTFLVSDGLAFGEGPFESMQQEAKAATIIMKATELLQMVVSIGMK